MPMFVCANGFWQLSAFGWHEDDSLRDIFPALYLSLNHSHGLIVKLNQVILLFLCYPFEYKFIFKISQFFKAKSLRDIN